MFCDKVVEGQRLVTVFNQLFNGELVFDPVGFHEEIESCICFLLGFGHSNVLEITLGFLVQRLGHYTSDVSHLVNPATLLAILQEHISQVYPKP